MLRVFAANVWSVLRQTSRTAWLHEVLFLERKASDRLSRLSSHWGAAYTAVRLGCNSGALNSFNKYEVASLVSLQKHYAMAEQSSFRVYGKPKRSGGLRIRVLFPSSSVEFPVSVEIRQGSRAFALISSAICLAMVCGPAHVEQWDTAVVLLLSRARQVHCILLENENIAAFQQILPLIVTSFARNVAKLAL